MRHLRYFNQINESVSHIKCEYRNGVKPEDVYNIENELQKIPKHLRKIMSSYGAYVVFFNGQITDNKEFEKNKGVRPRNYPIEYTWDNVQGAYDPDNCTVLIGISGNYIKHSQESLLLHEFAHCFDDLIGDHYFGKSISEKINFKKLSKEEPFYYAHMRSPYYYNLHEREYVANAIDLFYRNENTNKELRLNNPTIYKLLSSL